MINLSKIGFRSSMFGFNKADVNMYLLKIQQEFALKEQELLKKVADLEKENGDMFWGAGTDTDVIKASTNALLSAFHNMTKGDD